MSRHTAGARSRALLLTLVAAVVGSLWAVVPATVARADTGEGWVRLAHLSPDTPSVNVALTALADNRELVELSDVGYGDVSGYQKVPAGTYVASMTPAGGDAGSTPAITQAVTVEDGKAYTVAAVGLNAELKGTVLTDDLTPPQQGTAKIRLLQASISAPAVTVTAAGGPTLARDARFASATGYAEVPAGVWSVTITPTSGDAQPVTTDVTVGSASVNTVVVLDAEAGGVSALVVKDAEGVATMPRKGVPAGGGGLVTGGADPVPSGAVSYGPGALALVVLLGAGAATALVRRRSAQPARVGVTGS